mmetsp:Transcript_52530/g.139891  ORF Transcript_52530/g.139891 Transcript_52530/m.139891 type:complete len:298 (+) Transcript_52530:625-1518(+)
MSNATRSAFLLPGVGPHHGAALQLDSGFNTSHSTSALTLSITAASQIQMCCKAPSCVNECESQCSSLVDNSCSEQETREHSDVLSEGVVEVPELLLSDSSGVSLAVVRPLRDHRHLRPSPPFRAMRPLAKRQLRFSSATTAPQGRPSIPTMLRPTASMARVLSLLRGSSHELLRSPEVLASFWTHKDGCGTISPPTMAPVTPHGACWLVLPKLRAPAWCSCARTFASITHLCCKPRLSATWTEERHASLWRRCARTRRHSAKHERQPGQPYFPSRGSPPNERSSISTRQGLQASLGD